jgi:hypothetical protein
MGRGHHHVTVSVKNSKIIMISLNGPITKEQATKIRKFTKSKKLKSVAFCKLCRNPSKNFEHMLFIELSKGRMGHKGFPGYVGVCLDCIETNAIKEGIKKITVLNPS